ncbi:FkbM family methyltransferase [Methylobacterium nodulans]|uniref:Methyltransferase FkbM family n=1 Tax=Methylobacterium nodulans (strain LMG 21967 / CNCM I-2342 / ORS 2060) TaxID=460265 RepID=B8IAS4_METNO|nr:FkbM family methyltransferase [Methylobacterium nodulans]ACL61119.1 methyltransferase FkbM family [Methylobacterium nodulans ORS 2060]
MTDVREFLRQSAFVAGETQTLISRVSEASLFAKVAAINACNGNPFQPSLVWHPSIFGSLMQLNLREKVSQEIFLTGAFEPDVLWLLSCLVDEGSIAVDCGAHIGFFTLALSKLVGASGRVEAFEPTASSKACLDTNLCNAGVANVKAHQLAVWSESCILDFYDYGAELSAFNSVGAPRLGGGATSPNASLVRVPAVALDTFFETANLAPGFIKLDVENSEYFVLTGLKRTLSAVRPLLVVEVGDVVGDQKSAVSSTFDMLKILTDHAYSVFSIKACRLSALDIAPNIVYEYGNALAVPSERVNEILERTAGQS